jgi:uncharacterized phage infection (PIP) family protein YhgE
MQTLQLKVSTVALLAAGVAALLLMQGCSNSMHDEQASHEMNDGISTTREGLEAVSQGIDESEAGDVAGGITYIDTGMGMMAEGMNGMASGMNKMPDGMMKGCCQGSEAMMAAMQQAMQQIREGRDLVNDDAADNDAEGVAKMQDGATAMAAALDEAGESMNCMGRSSMSQMM